MHQNEPLPADVRAGLQKVNELLECRSPLEVFVSVSPQNMRRVPH